jgi:hypothetical protein
MSTYVYKTYSEFTVCLSEKDKNTIMDFVDDLEEYDFKEYNSSTLLNLVCNLPEEYDPGRCEGTKDMAKYLYAHLNNPECYISYNSFDLRMKASVDPKINYLYL